MLRKLWLGLVASAVLALAGCGGSVSSTSTQKPDSAMSEEQFKQSLPENQPGDTVTTDTTTTDEPTTDGTSSAAQAGVGSTQAAFEAAHPGANHEADIPGANDYVTVTYDKGRVTGYSLLFHPDVNRSEALAQVMAELPSDARKVAGSRLSACEQFVFESATLSASSDAAGLSKSGQPTFVLVELESGEIGDPYNSSAVSAATFTATSSGETVPLC